MAKVDIQKLKSDAEKYRGKGKLDKAIELYEEIEKNKGADAKTLQKMAEIYLKLEDADKGVETYRKAMKSYRETGFLVQAIAVGKILQELCENNEEINKEIEEMLAKKAGGPLKTIGKQMPAKDAGKAKEEAKAAEPEEPAKESAKETAEEEKPEAEEAGGKKEAGEGSGPEAEGAAPRKRKRGRPRQRPDPRKKPISISFYSRTLARMNWPEFTRNCAR